MRTNQFWLATLLAAGLATLTVLLTALSGLLRLLAGLLSAVAQRAKRSFVPRHSVHCRNHSS
jgi:membrane protein YqaA with SNARE-associated domain